MPHKSVVLIMACLSFIAGIAIGTATPISQDILYWSAIFGVVITGVGWARLPMVLGVIVLACTAGMWRAHVHSLPDALPEGQQTFRGEVVRQPEIRIDSQRLVVDPGGGLIQVSTILQPRYAVGDILEVSCNLKTPEAFDGFAYDKYLERHGIVRTCSFAQITKTGERESLRRTLFGFKQRASGQVQKTIAPPEHTIILGALFGDKKAIPENIAEYFRRTGTSHVLVISGLHIGLITIIIAEILEWLALKRPTRFVFIAGALATYVLLTGAQPSAIRASSFGVAILIAQLLGRPRSLLRLLVYIATIMLAVNPLLLWHDVGFQLSFAATTGIIVLHERIAKALHILPEKIAQLLGVTIAATLTTAPLIAHHFGTFSPVSLLANIVLVPLMPLLMLSSILVTAVASIHLQAAQIIGIPLYYALHFFIAIAEWFSKLPLAQITL